MLILYISWIGPLSSIDFNNHIAMNEVSNTRLERGRQNNKKYKRIVDRIRDFGFAIFVAGDLLAGRQAACMPLVNWLQYFFRMNSGVFQLIFNNR